MTVTRNDMDKISTIQIPEPDVVDTDQWRVVVQPIPRDGNCLFASLVHQIDSLEISSSLHIQRVQILRQLVASHIAEQASEPFGRLQSAIISRTCEEWPQLRNAAFETQAFRLAEYLRVDGHWGGEEAIVAVVDLFNVAVEIFYERHFQCTFFPTSNAPIKTLRIAYRLQPGSVDNFNHYDSVLSATALVNCDEEEDNSLRMGYIR